MRFILPLLLLVPTIAFADPVSIGVALISTGSAAAIGGSAALLFGSAFYHFAAVLALSELSRALTPKPEMGSPQSRAYEVSGVAPAAPVAIIYGRTKVGGIIVYKETTESNKYLDIVVAIAGHEVEDIEEVYFDDTSLVISGSGADGVQGSVTSDKYKNQKGEVTAFVTKHFGADDQVADANLVQNSAGKWTANHRLQGVAYVYIRLKHDADVYPNGEPAFSFVVKGKKVYNPNTQTTAYSANAALCLRDYMTSSYGLGADASEIDDVSFAAAAAICDEDVTLASGGTQKRYEINGSLVTDIQPMTAIDDMTKSMAGSIWYAQGKFRVKAGAWTSPTVSLDENDNRSSIQIATRHSRRENFNAVAGQFRGEESSWIATDFPKVVSEQFRLIDGGDTVSTDIALPFTSSSAMAQRLAKIMLYRNREQISISGNFGVKAFGIQVGDVIQYSNAHLGFSNKTFEVVSWQFVPGEGNVEIAMGLTELSPAVFDWDANELEFELNNTELADAFTVPPVGLTVTSETKIINEHVLSVLRATVTATAPERIDYVVVEYKLAAETIYNQLGVGELGFFDGVDLVNGIYDVRARAVNTIGRKGDFTTIQFNLEGLIAAPNDVTELSANVNNGVTTLEWSAIADLDLSYYRVRHALETTGASFADATTSFDKVPRPATSATVPARSGTYMIRAYDKLGIPSENFTSVVVLPESLTQYTTTLTQTEHAAFSGTKTGCSVTSGELRITDPSSSPSTASYDFSNYIDTGAVRLAHATCNVRVNRFNTGGDLWDDLTGNTDSFSGLWDDLTANPQEADTNVLFYISATDGDPSGSPTWSSYTLFKSGQFSGRAFRFKVELKSDADGVTPSLSELFATVEYN